jgi:hypothetical protein
MSYKERGTKCGVIKVFPPLMCFDLVQMGRMLEGNSLSCFSSSALNVGARIMLIEYEPYIIPSKEYANRKENNMICFKIVGNYLQEIRVRNLLPKCYKLYFISF